MGVPAAGEFLAAYAPEGIAEMVGWPLPLRVVMPLTAMGGILIAGAWGAWPARGAARWVAGGVLLVAAGWAAGELRHVWRRGAAVTATREVSAMQGLSERAVMDRFVYDLLRIPAYFSHGKVDPRLETRLLDEAGQVIIGPDEVARRMEEAGVEEFDLRVRPHAVAGGPWLEFEPRIAVEPGEQVLLAFEFREEDYAGHLILTSRHGRREYILPRSGLGQAFGTEASSSRVISLWNSRAETQEYKGEMVARPEHAAEVRDGVFARVRRSRFDPERAPIRMRSWMPYRAEVEAGEGVAWVETPRAFIPGYKATVDGVEAPVVRSVQHLVKVPVEPGQRLVEVRYAGTTRLWGGLVVSGLTWIGLLGWWGWASRRAGADQSSQG